MGLALTGVVTMLSIGDRFGGNHSSLPIYFTKSLKEKGKGMQLYA